MIKFQATESFLREFKLDEITIIHKKSAEKLRTLENNLKASTEALLSKFL